MFKVFNFKMFKVTTNTCSCIMGQQWYTIQGETACVWYKATNTRSCIMGQQWYTIQGVTACVWYKVTNNTHMDANGK